MLTSIRSCFIIIAKNYKKKNEKVLHLAISSAVFFLRKEHFDEHFQANWRIQTSQSVQQEICKQKAVNFKRKLNGTENILFFRRLKSTQTTLKQKCLPLKVPTTNL